MKKLLWLGLQFFAGEGSGASGDGGASSGEGAVGTATTGDATADAAQRLRELGVPEDKIRKRASKIASKLPPVQTAKAEVVEEPSAPATEEAPVEENKESAPTRMTWDEIMADPEYNKQMQATIQKRLKSDRKAEESLAKLAPALEVLARKHKLDPNNMDYDALAKAINDDQSLYEDKAIELGVDVETAMKLDQKERADARTKAQEEQTIREQMMQKHFESLEQQGDELKKVYPDFNLQKELQNPVFARMTAPGVGVPVKVAYNAIHHDEIQTAAMQVTAKKTTEKISNAIQAGSRRPDEAGITSRAPSTSTFDYSKASKEQRQAFKKDLMARLARGEKVYPGQ